MPRIGHKEGCHCAICRAIDRKGNPVAIPAIPEGSILFKDALIGQNFRYGGQVWKKINHGVVLNFQNSDDSTEPMDNNTVIEPILPGHEVEPDA